MQKEIFVNLLGILKQTMLKHFKDIDACACMIPITETDIESIENSGFLTITAPSTGKKVTININRIFLYGEVSVNNKEDIEMLKDYNLVNDVLNEFKSFTYENFDYDKGGYVKVSNKPSKQYPIIDPVLNFKIHHCLLGKPKYICVFKIQRNYLRELL